MKTLLSSSLEIEIDRKIQLNSKHTHIFHNHQSKNDNTQKKGELNISSLRYTALLRINKIKCWKIWMKVACKTEKDEKRNMRKAQTIFFFFTFHLCLWQFFSWFGYDAFICATTFVIWFLVSLEENSNSSKTKDFFPYYFWIKITTQIYRWNLHALTESRFQINGFVLINESIKQSEWVTLWSSIHFIVKCLSLYIYWLCLHVLLANFFSSFIHMIICYFWMSFVENSIENHFCMRIYIHFIVIFETQPFPCISTVSWMLSFFST